MELAPAEDDYTRVYKWRRRTLKEAGYDRRTADLLASQTDVDLHEALDLIRNGCPPEQAAKILL